MDVPGLIDSSSQPFPRKLYPVLGIQSVQAIFSAEPYAPVGSYLLHVVPEIALANFRELYAVSLSADGCKSIRQDYYFYEPESDRFLAVEKRGNQFFPLESARWKS